MLNALPAHRSLHGPNGPSDIFFAGHPVRNADSHAAASAPGSAAEEGFAVGDDGGDHFIGAAVVGFFPSTPAGAGKPDPFLAGERHPPLFPSREAAHTRPPR